MTFIKSDACGVFSLEETLTEFKLKWSITIKTKTAECGYTVLLFCYY